MARTRRNSKKANIVRKRDGDIKTGVSLTGKKRKRSGDSDDEEGREKKSPRRSTRDRRPQAERAKGVSSPDEINARNIGEGISRMIRKEDRDKAYRQYSFDNNRALILNFPDAYKESWANSLSATERALVRELIENDEDYKENRAPKLNALHFAIDSSQTFHNDFATGGGVGTPGMSKVNIANAIEVEANVAITHIRKKILEDEGAEIRRLIRSGTDQQKREARDKAIELIRRIYYPDAHLIKTEGRAEEVHAIGLGNDVLAVRLSGLDEERRLTAAPYDSIASEVDEIERWTSQQKSEIIAYYAGFLEALPDGIKVEDLSSEDGAILREFATIQIAEKGRELRRVDEANIVPEGGKGKGEKVEDKKLVEGALEKAGENGFYKTYVENSQEDAVFAQKGGQDELRKAYGINK